MAANLEVRDLPDRLEYRVTQSHSQIHLTLRVIAWVIALCIPILLARESVFFAVLMTGIILYAGVNDIQGARQGTDVTLTVTQRDIISYGYTQNEYYPLNRWRTQAPDLSWQEEHSNGENGPLFPHGASCGSDCVLPLVSMREGHRIVEEVYSRFPDTAMDSNYDSTTVPPPIITLGLSK